MHILEFKEYKTDKFIRVAVSNSDILAFSSNKDKYNSDLSSSEIDKKRQSSEPLNFFVKFIESYNTGEYHYVFLKQQKDKSTEITDTLKPEQKDEFLKEKSVILKDGEYYFQVNHFANFLQVDDNDNIIYPFKCYSFDIGTIKQSTLTLAKSTKYTNLLPVDLLLNEPLILKILKETGVDIESYVTVSKLWDRSFIHLDEFNKYIKYYYEIPEYRKCVQSGIAEAFTWTKYAFKTVQSKAKEMYSEVRKVQGELPDYIKKLCIQEGKYQYTNKQIIKLYNLGFTAQCFLMFQKIFKNFAYSSFLKFMWVYDMCDEFFPNKYECIDILNFIQYNASSRCQKSTSNLFDFLEYCKKAMNNIPTLDSAFKQKICDHFVSTGLTSDVCYYLKSEIKEKNKQLFYDCFNQYTNISYSNKYLQRISHFSDLPEYIRNWFYCYISEFVYIGKKDIFEPNKDEIIYLYKVYSNNNVVREYIVKINLSNQSFTTHDRGKLCTMNDEITQYISTFLNQHVFPKYIDAVIDKF